jgi:hypothetical protein
VGTIKFYEKHLPERMIVGRAGVYTSDGSYAYAYAVSMAMLQVLKQCEGDFTRENIMKQATNLRDLELPTLLPGTGSSHSRRICAHRPL